MKLACALACVGALACVSMGQLVNVAAGRAPSLVSGTLGDGSLLTLTDGVFLPRSQQWQTDTVWWDGFDVAIQIDLGGVFGLIGSTVQADDNDAYLLQYRRVSDGAWLTLWDVPNYDDQGWGMQTRPDPANDAAVYMFDAPVMTDAVRFMATSGDASNSVSEIQVFVPTPGAVGVLGLAGLFGLRRRR